MTLMSISSMEQKGLCFPAPLQGWPCPWPPHWESVGPEALPTASYMGKRSFASLCSSTSVSSPIGDKLAPVLCPAVLMGRDVTHPLAAPTWVPLATGAWSSSSTALHLPVIQDLITGSQTLKHPQAHTREFSFQAHRRPCLKMEFHRSINTGID